MAIKIEYNPDGTIKSAISVNPDGTPSVASQNVQTPLPGYMYGPGGMMLGEMSKRTPGVMTEFDKQMRDRINNIMMGNIKASNPLMTDSMLSAIKRATENIKNMQNQKFDAITGQEGQRTLEDFKNHLKLNKEGMLRNEGKFPGERGEGLKGFNKYLDALQEGVYDQLSPEEAKFVDDLKNNRVNL
jgi:hypothetical protein